MPERRVLSLRLEGHVAAGGCPLIAETEKYAVVRAWCEYATGPGWTNRLVWVLLRRSDGRLELRSIQPDVTNVELLHLNDVADAANKLCVKLTRTYLPAEKRDAVLAAWPVNRKTVSYIAHSADCGYVVKEVDVSLRDAAIVEVVRDVLWRVAQLGAARWRELEAANSKPRR
jgi:hypothetical protein